MSWRHALVQIAGMFAVMLVGWLARRRELLPAATIGALSRFVVDLALPALILDQMLSMQASAVAAGWMIPLAALVLIALSFALGAATAPLFAKPGTWRTYVFLAATANWIYLPLPIADALFGEAGKLVVLLYNVGGLVMLWTAGVWLLRGRADRSTLRELLLNPGLLATVAGVALALGHAGQLVESDRGGLGVVVLAAREALRLVGSLTVPLSLLFIGAQLGPARGGERDAGAVAGVVLVRLVLAPAATLLVLLLATRSGVAMAPATWATLTLIGGMPVAVSCAVITDRYGGDAGLASRAIFASTLASVATTPALIYLLGRLGPMG